MWRAFFLAVGISMVILGAECLIVDKAVISLPNRKNRPALGINSANLLSTSVGSTREVKPPEWAPWSLLSGGVVVAIYSFTLRRD